MATPQPQRGNANEPAGQDGNPSNSAARPASAPNETDDSLSTAGEHASGKGSKTNVRKDE